MSENDPDEAVIGGYHVYRTIQGRFNRIYELAARDRQMSETLYSWGNRFHSVNDPIEAEIYRIRCELYCALVAEGTDKEQAFEAHYERAKAACEQFNARQATRLKRSWHPTDAGHFSPEAAWQWLRHAVRMYERVMRYGY